MAGEEGYYYFYNAHGDVVRLSGAGNGMEVKYRYDAFGTLISVEGDADNSITYAGYQYDAESGLYYLNARYYDSTTARFLTEDTYGGSADDPLSLNRYTYCANNPLCYTDPSGHFWSAIIIVLVNVVKDAAIGAGIELTLQIIEQPDDISAEEVVFEAVFSGATTFLGGVYSVARKAEKTINTVRKVQKAAKATKIANATFKGVLKAGAKEVPEGLVEDLAHQFFVEDKALDGLDLGQALEAAAISGIMGANDKLMDDLLPKNRHGAKDGKKASQTTGLIADAADDGPRPKADALSEGNGKGVAKGQKVNGTVKSGSTGGGGASKNQGKMQSQTVDSSVRSDKVAPKPGETGVRKGPKGLIGVQFEEYLTNTLGGNGSFKLGGKEFDGSVGNRFWKAKSGQFWIMMENNSEKLQKFKDSMGHHKRIANDHGATFEIFSNTPIPQTIKDWLTEKGMPFTEMIQL